jgi:acetolactate synthase-1/2/3 large subunit
MTVLTGGAALVAGLAAHGVDTVFGIPGTHNLPIYAALADAGVRHVLPRHEQGAGYAADGWARASGRPGVCITTTGPAVLNAAAAAAQAYSDSVPVLLVSPGLPLAHPGRGNGYLHEVRDQHAAVAAVVKESHRVTSVGEIPLAVAQCFASMASGRPRPVYLEIPLDLLDRAEPVEVVGPIAVPKPAPDASAVAAAVRAVRSAERPVIVAGGGAVDAADEVQRLAEALGAPVVTTANGKGVLDDAHPLAIGAGLHHAAVRRLVADSDLVLAIGTELAPSDLWYGPLDVTAPLVRIDVDATSIATNAVPDVAVVADARRALDALLGGLADVPRGEGKERAARWRAEFRADARREGAAYLDLVGALSAGMGRGGVLAGDSTMACYYGALSNLATATPRSFLYPTGLGTLGYGLPAAIGAKLARPDARVAALLGDGGVMFTIAELAAAAQVGLPIAVVVVDNGGYGEIRDEMAQRGEPVHAVELGRVDFAGVAESFGCHGVLLDDVDQLEPALARAFAADRPTLVHVRMAGAA